MRKINKIIIHCSDSAWADADVIDAWHKERGWDGIGYHAVINNGYRKNSREFDTKADGLIQMGRELSTTGAHCRGHNKDSLGICLVGIDKFTSNQWYSLRQLVSVWRQLYQVDEGMVQGHNYFDDHKTCPNFDVAAFFGRKAA